jgi:hypothetical protein
MKRTNTRTSKREGRESKNQGREYERCMTEEIPEDLGRESAREKNEGEIQMWERGERKQDWMEGEERRCRICYEERKTIKHMWNGCSEMKERSKGVGRNTE